MKAGGVRKEVNGVVVINRERCDGCGACVEACPSGALYLVDGKATLDETLCRECEACVAACPTGAISLAVQREMVSIPASRPETEIIQVKTRPAPAPLTTRALPVVGAALAWAGREIVPRLADYLFGALARRGDTPQRTDSAGSNDAAASGEGRGGHRHGWRGGQGQG